MSSDLIYREDAKDYVRYAFAKGLNVLEYLDEVPAANFRPVVRAHWVERKINDGIPNMCYFSSCCGFPSWYGKLNFCPNCGAMMEDRKE